MRTREFSLEVLCFNSLVLFRLYSLLSRFSVKKTLFNEYKLLKRLDKGGFATVFLASKISGGKKYAIKMIEKKRIKSERNYVSRTAVFYKTNTGRSTQSMK